MKKKTTLALISMLLCVNASLFSQELYVKEKPVHYTLASTKANNDGGVSVTIINQRDAYRLNTQGILIAGATTENLNQYISYTYDPEGKLTTTDDAYYTKSGGSWRVGTITNNEGFESVKLEEVTAKEPDLFVKDKRTQYASEAISVRSYEQSYNPLLLAYEGRTNEKNFQPRHPNYTTNKKLNTFSHQYAINKELGYVTTFFGNKDLVNKSNKKNHRKDFDFISYNFDNEIINQFNVKFQYPRVFYKLVNVYSEDDPTKEIGKLYIFKKATKKDGPDPSMFDVVYCSGKGELYFQIETKLGTIDKNRITVDCALGNSEKVSLLVNARIEDVLKVGLVTLDKAGTTTTHFITNADMKAMAKKFSYPNDANPKASRKILGTFASVPGYKFGFSEEFIVGGINKLDNGDIGIWGQMLYEVNDPNVPQGTSSLSVPKIKRYAEFVCFQFSSAYDIKNVFIHDLPPVARPSSINIVSGSGNTLNFLIPIASDKPAAAIKSIQTFKGTGDKVVPKYPGAYLYVPELFKIDGNSGEATKEVMVNKLMVNPSIGYQYNEISNKLFIPCFNKNDNTKMVVSIFNL